MTAEPRLIANRERVGPKSEPIDTKIEGNGQYQASGCNVVLFRRLIG